MKIIFLRYKFSAIKQSNYKKQKIRRSEVVEDCHVLDRELVGRAMYGKECNTVIDGNR
ncbi:hypothetical protein SEENIN0B_01993 [Salmonella enterica subsp. enterica serovar Infantis str. SARB27]|uniref:Uncharacterized protein n=1 Tax=Salmonella enterica subsp. enterica serovar Infantis str. SARB27 TaxID=596155 RepID=A0A6C8G8E8_SALIN|nr:hypothetical protein SEENIN0B_01993 [Salmonella enterica subsp. enterica serovar Infantis str. SARB27]